MDVSGILTVSKVIIAGAWVDGDLTQEEAESLKDLVYRFSHLFPSAVGISARQWAELEIYIDSPVSTQERERLFEELRATPLSEEDKAEILAAFQDLIQSDGKITENERQIFDQVAHDLEHLHASLFGQIGRAVKNPLSRRGRAMRDAPNREEHLDEFIHNRIFYRLQQREGFDAEKLAGSEYDLRKLCAAGGLMARVARADQSVSDAEFEVIRTALQPAGLGLSDDESAIIAEIAISEAGRDIDLHRLVRELFTRTSPQERRSFLEVLIAVAAADQEITPDEDREIESLAISLNINRREFLDIRETFG
jgi:uncharacterized tellurite resistance protein B-like protein